MRDTFYCLVGAARRSIHLPTASSLRSGVLRLWLLAHWVCRYHSTSHGRMRALRPVGVYLNSSYGTGWGSQARTSGYVWLMLRTTDHDLPTATHLKYNFPVLESVARARARMAPFNNLRDPDDLPAPGAMIYMDFAGPCTPSFSYPHQYTSYCGAIDVGSGYARIVPCHSPTKAEAQRCLELLLADMRTLMGLTHKLRPQVVVSDQGAQFMSHHFVDFLSSEHIRHWPSTTYTPQQNSVAERMWGTRFSMDRALCSNSQT